MPIQPGMVSSCPTSGQSLRTAHCKAFRDDQPNHGGCWTPPASQLRLGNLCCAPLTGSRYRPLAYNLTPSRGRLVAIPVQPGGGRNNPGTPPMAVAPCARHTAKPHPGCPRPQGAGGTFPARFGGSTRLRHQGAEVPPRAGSAWKRARHGPAEDSASDSDRAGGCPPFIPQAGLAPASVLPLADCDFGHVPRRPPTPT